MGTILVTVLVMAIVGLVIYSMAKNKKEGKSSCSSCGGACAHCTMQCHHKTEM
ncbi:MAG: FeoB-associated Cys-rich membrane protein [Clostridia bacterium]|nr:FeoB-associated Cys-rich membrane protein [Clostridia bacterium]